MKKLIEARIRYPGIEAVAKLCHSQWSNWMKYLFNKGAFNEDGTWTMSKEFVDRWVRQAIAEYADLSEPEKESDRTEAKKFIELFYANKIE